MSMKKICLFALSITFCTISPISMVEPWLFDINFRSHIQRTKTHEFLIIPNFAFSGHGWNSLGDKVNPLQYLDPTQDALAMLKGFPANSIESQIGQQINIDDDNGTRGHFIVTGNYSFEEAILSYRYRFFSEWFLGVRLPVFAARINNTQWVDETQNFTYDDVLTKELVTNNIFQNAETWGDLNLQNWSTQNIGDTTITFNWLRAFLQEKPYLKEVDVNARIGIAFPTCYRKNEDVAFSMSLGNDGAFAMPFGAGIDLRFKKFLQAGVDVSFEYIFSHIKNRRIVTDPAQTNFLLLQKAKTLKDYGITQMFNLYLEPQINDYLAFRVAYQHIKHAKDKVYILNNEYSTLIANQTLMLKEWTKHAFFFQLRYDNAGSRGLISPIVSVFGFVPFNGKRSLQPPLVGFDLAFHF